MTIFNMNLKTLLILAFIISFCLASDKNTAFFIKIEKNGFMPNSVSKLSSPQYRNTILKSPQPNFFTAKTFADENKTSSANNDEESELITFISNRQSLSKNRSRRTVNSYISTTMKPEITTSIVLKKWMNSENTVKTFARSAIKNVLPSFMDMTANLNISSTCTKELMQLIAGLRDIKTWAFRFVDSSAGMVGGLLSGTLSSLGDYDACLGIKVISDRRGQNFGKLMFTGKFCSIDIKPPLPPKKDDYNIFDPVEDLKEFSQGDTMMNELAKFANSLQFLSVRLGVCVPSGCELSDIQQVADTVARQLEWSANVKRCEVKTEKEYTPLVIGIMTVFSFFGFLLCVGSFIDLYYAHFQKEINHTFLEVLVSFSFVKNFKKLVAKSKGNLSCLNGFRFLSISWIIIAHTYLTANFNLIKGSRQTLDYPKDISYQVVLNASVAVDSFFFIGGLLVCYVTVSVVRETGKPLSIFLYIFHRLFRIIPVYAAVICGAFLVPLMGSGPIWPDTVQPYVDGCYKNWWTNILFVNNFINVNQICFLHTWYVAADMQLYIAALIVILPILRWPRIGLSIAFVGIAASIITTSVITYTYNVPPTTLFIQPDDEHRLALTEMSYFKPYPHAGPYCIGLIAGYILATKPKLKFSMVTRIIGWTCAVICNMAVLYGVYEWNSGRNPEKTETFFYSGLHRVAWTLGVAWVIVNCAIGQGGIVNYILSWRVWIPLGRLTYTVYLIHFIVQVVYIGSTRIQFQPDHYYAVWLFFGYLMITTGLAFVASMLVEAPFINLEKIVLRAIAGKPQKKANGHAAVQSDSTVPKPDHHEPVNNGAIISRL